MNKINFISNLNSDYVKREFFILKVILYVKLLHKQDLENL